MSHIRPDVINTKSLANLCKLALLRDGCSLRGAAKMLGCSPSLLSRVQNGKSDQVGGDNLLILLCWIKKSTGMQWNDIMPKIVGG